MKYDILVVTHVNDQPAHIFVQHHGIREAKVEDLEREIIKEQYERLERGRPSDYLYDGRTPYGVIMSRAYDTGSVTTVHIIVAPTNEARPYWEAQNARRDIGTEN